jgi:hypothetical protein
MSESHTSITEFVKRVKEDEKFRYEFFSAEDPAQFLNSMTRIIIPDDQKEDFKNYVTSLKDKYTKKTVKFMTEEDRECYEIIVEIEPPG